MDIPNEQGLPVSGAIGVLLLFPSHLAGDFTQNWQRGFIQNGRRVEVPLLLATGESWANLSEEIWKGWVIEAETSLLALTSRCENIFIVGIASAASLALRVAQIHGGDIDGIILLDPSVPHELRKLRKIWKTLEEEFYFVDQPLFLTYSSNESDLSHVAAKIISEAVSSPLIREILVESPLEELTLVAGEVDTFIGEVVHGFWHATASDDNELIDAEFESIVAGLALDESSPSNFLDDLDRLDPDDHFVAPDPELAPIADRARRNAIFAMVVGPIYAISAALAGFNPFGIEPWPGLVAFLGGLIYFFYGLQEDRGDDDGAIL